MTDWSKIMSQIPEAVENLDDVPDKLKQVYDKDEESGGFKFVGTETLFNSMKNAKLEKQELSGKLAAATERLAKFSAIGSIEDISTLAEKRAELEAAKVDKNKDVETARQEFAAKMADQEREHQAQIGVMKATLDQIVEREALSGITTGLNLTDLGQEFLPVILGRQLKIELGDNAATQIKVVNDQGEVQTNPNLDPMTPKDLVEKIKEAHPEMFASDGVGGMGSKGSTSAGGLPVGGKPFGKWSQGERIAYAKKHGPEAYRKMANESAAQAAKEAAAA